MPRAEGVSATKDTPRPVLVALLMLTLVTGIVDAASVLGLAHVFTANMTGNVVFLGFALAGKGTVSVAATLDALSSFALGALVGGRLTQTIGATALRRSFGIELAALVAAAVVAFFDGYATTTLIVSLLAFAMGLRNAVIRKLAVVDLTTTVLTLTVTGLAADSPLAGGTAPRWGRRLMAVAAMLVGALLGAAVLPWGMGWVLGVAALIETSAVVVLLVSPLQEPRS